MIHGFLWAPPVSSPRAVRGWCLFDDHVLVTGKPVPAKVSCRSLVRSAKEETRAAGKNEENKPLAQVHMVH